MKIRQSNIELLRIISIFLILVVHSDFLILGSPTEIDFKIDPVSSMTRTIFEMLSVICVNIFVFISGWFSIRFSIKGIFKLLFQIFFLQSLLYLILLILNKESFCFGDIKGIFMLDRYFWFVKAYIGLVIISPIINTFVKFAPLKATAIVLLSYYIFQTTYAWFTDGAWFLSSGYCITSISAIYLLARFIRTYTDRNGMKYDFKNKYKYLWLYLFLAIFNSGLYFLSFKIPGGNYFRDRLIYYTSPIVIFQSICLFMFFLRIKLKQNNVINWIAASSFAVFIVHATHGMKYYALICEYIYSEYSGIICISLLFIMMLGIYIMSILFDYPRKIIWNWLEHHIPDYKIE